MLRPAAAAGSERLDKSGSTGARAAEACHINTTLSVLGRCIQARAAGNAVVPFRQERRSAALLLCHNMRLHDGVRHCIASQGPAQASHCRGTNPGMPYGVSPVRGCRECKLTRLLQDSFGGAAKAAVLLCLSDALEHADEGLASLELGARARQVRNRPTLNVLRSPGSPAATAAMPPSLRALRALLDAQRSFSGGGNPGGGGMVSMVCSMVCGVRSIRRGALAINLRLGGHVGVESHPLGL